MRYRNSGRCSEAISCLCVINIKQKSSHLQRGKVTTCTNRLSCNIFDRFASIETYNIVLPLVQAFYKALNCYLVEIPNGVCLFIIELSCCIKHEFSEGSNSFSSDFFIFVRNYLGEKLSKPAFCHLISNNC